MLLWPSAKGDALKEASWLGRGTGKELKVMELAGDMAGDAAPKDEPEDWRLGASCCLHAPLAQIQ